jgi:NTE family protein
VTTAWVLRGGASFAAAQVGMAQALIEAGHHPDILYGTSAGALNASWLAASPTREGLDELARLWTRVRRRDVFPLQPWHALSGLIGWQDFTVSADGLARWLRATAPLRRLEDGVLPLTVVAADLEGGQEVLLESGPAVPALLASSAMPGIFPPVRIEDRWLVDGSVASDSPIGAAVKAGASRVWLLPSAPSGPMPRPKGALDVMLRSTSIVLGRQVEAAVTTWASRCELFVLPAPLVPGVSPFSFTKSRELISSAYHLTREWLKEARPEAEPNAR